MLTKGLDCDVFVMMHKRAGLAVANKGVVYPFLAPGDLK